MGGAGAKDRVGPGSTGGVAGVLAPAYHPCQTRPQSEGATMNRDGLLGRSRAGERLSRVEIAALDQPWQRLARGRGCKRTLYLA